MAKTKTTKTETTSTTPARRTVTPPRMLKQIEAEMEKRGLTEANTIGDLLGAYRQTIIDDAMVGL